MPETAWHNGAVILKETFQGDLILTIGASKRRQELLLEERGCLVWKPCIIYCSAFKVLFAHSVAAKQLPSKYLPLPQSAEATAAAAWCWSILYPQRSLQVLFSSSYKMQWNTKEPEHASKRERTANDPAKWNVLCMRHMQCILNYCAI